MARAVIKSTLGLAQPRVLRFAFSIDPTSNPLVSDLGAIMFSESPSRIPASNCAPESDNDLFAMLSLKIHQSREGVVLT
ncbi:hypothetical protein HBI25_219260 [Parastagonospora nodorum]|nr:hypothetical protein HBH52_231350 [Parastagonospora nodorum]KAH3991949.1 hypothetical protein HBI10_223470 [Parastagonospora nodorum]KAH4009859.1 hypothetical protein HBI13_215970 [Parastagonospora nodorum]KAH4016853.1 hypothetical protein HBI09_201000 [Parastagonospora nodorum]KAH4043702.1 hypothetical protein HBH49_230150 [Parastagonospora nodorum]